MSCKGITGLDNIGNTCYFNSIIQCLSNIKEFKDFIIDNKILKFIINKETDKDTSILYQLNKLLKELWKHDDDISLRPTSLKKLIGDKNDMFDNYSQHDSQEFLLCILSLIDDEINLNVKINSNILSDTLIDKIINYSEDELFIYIQEDYIRIKELAFIYMKKSYEKNYSIITKYFGGMLLFETKCPITDKISYSFELSNMISLPIKIEDEEISEDGDSSEDKNIVDCDYFNRMSNFDSSDSDSEEYDILNTYLSPEPELVGSMMINKIIKKYDKPPIELVDCLKEFFSKEYLDEDNEWFSPFCKKDVHPIKQIKIWSLPKLLIIHLKRFYYNGNIKKINKKINFPLYDLDMTSYVDERNINDKKYFYDLIAINLHTGTPNFGHYYSYCKNGDKWYKYNDDTVNEIDESDLKSNDSYILFYKLKE